MKFTPMQCPQCGENAIGTSDTLPCVALFNVFDDGVEYSGTTTVHWDGQTTETSDVGEVMLQCAQGHEWWSEMDAEHECEEADKSIVGKAL